MSTGNISTRTRTRSRRISELNKMKTRNRKNFKIINQDKEEGTSESDSDPENKVHLSQIEERLDKLMFQNLEPCTVKPCNIFMETKVNPVLRKSIVQKALNQVVSSTPMYRTRNRFASEKSLMLSPIKRDDEDETINDNFNKDRVITISSTDDTSITRHVSLHQNISDRLRSKTKNVVADKENNYDNCGPSNISKQHEKRERASSKILRETEKNSAGVSKINLKNQDTKKSVHISTTEIDNDKNRSQYKSSKHISTTETGNDKNRSQHKSSTHVTTTEADGNHKNKSNLEHDLAQVPNSSCQNIVQNTENNTISTPKKKSSNEVIILLNKILVKPYLSKSKKEHAVNGSSINDHHNEDKDESKLDDYLQKVESLSVNKSQKNLRHREDLSTSEVNLIDTSQKRSQQNYSRDADDVNLDDTGLKELPKSLSKTASARKLARSLFKNIPGISKVKEKKHNESNLDDYLKQADALCDKEEEEVNRSKHDEEKAVQEITTSPLTGSNTLVNENLYSDLVETQAHSYKGVQTSIKHSRPKLKRTVASCHESGDSFVSDHLEEMDENMQHKSCLEDNLEEIDALCENKNKSRSQQKQIPHKEKTVQEIPTSPLTSSNTSVNENLYSDLVQTQAHSNKGVQTSIKHSRPKLKEKKPTFVKNIFKNNVSCQTVASCHESDNSFASDHLEEMDNMGDTENKNMQHRSCLEDNLKEIDALCENKNKIRSQQKQIPHKEKTVQEIPTSPLTSSNTSVNENLYSDLVQTQAHSNKGVQTSIKYSRPTLKEKKAKFVKNIFKNNVSSQTVASCHESDNSFASDHLEEMDNMGDTENKNMQHRSCLKNNLKDVDALCKQKVTQEIATSPLGNPSALEKSKLIEPRINSSKKKKSFTVGKDMIDVALSPICVSGGQSELQIPKSDISNQGVLSEIDELQSSKKENFLNSSTPGTMNMSYYEQMLLYKTLTEQRSLVPDFSDSDEDECENERGTPWRVNEDYIPNNLRARESIKLSFLNENRKNNIDSKSNESKVESPTGAVKSNMRRETKVIRYSRSKKKPSSSSLNIDLNKNERFLKSPITSSIKSRSPIWKNQNINTDLDQELPETPPRGNSAAVEYFPQSPTNESINKLVFSNSNSILEKGETEQSPETEYGDKSKKISTKGKKKSDANVSRNTACLNDTVTRKSKVKPNSSRIVQSKSSQGNDEIEQNPETEQDDHFNGPDLEPNFNTKKNERSIATVSGNQNCNTSTLNKKNEVTRKSSRIVQSSSSQRNYETEQNDHFNDVGLERNFSTKEKKISYATVSRTSNTSSLNNTVIRKVKPSSSRVVQSKSSQGNDEIEQNPETEQDDNFNDPDLERNFNTKEKKKSDANVSGNQSCNTSTLNKKNEVTRKSSRIVQSSSGQRNDETEQNDHFNDVDLERNFSTKEKKKSDANVSGNQNCNTSTLNKKNEVTRKSSRTVQSSSTQRNYETEQSPETEDNAVNDQNNKNYENTIKECKEKNDDEVFKKPLPKRRGRKSKMKEVSSMTLSDITGNRKSSRQRKPPQPIYESGHLVTYMNSKELKKRNESGQLPKKPRHNAEGSKAPQTNANNTTTTSNIVPAGSKKSAKKRKKDSQSETTTVRESKVMMIQNENLIDDCTQSEVIPHQENEKLDVANADSTTFRNDSKKGRKRQKNTTQTEITKDNNTVGETDMACDGPSMVQDNVFNSLLSNRNSIENDHFVRPEAITSTDSGQFSMRAWSPKKSFRVPTMKVNKSYKKPSKVLTNSMNSSKEIMFPNTSQENTFHWSKYVADDMVSLVQEEENINIRYISNHLLKTDKKLGVILRNDEGKSLLGYINLDPQEMKHPRLSKQFHSFFIVMEGIGELCVNENKHDIAENTCFKIAKGTTYSIQNTSCKDLLRMFVIRHE